MQESTGGSYDGHENQIGRSLHSRDKAYNTQHHTQQHTQQHSRERAMDIKSHQISPKVLQVNSRQPQQIIAGKNANIFISRENRGILAT
jgi:hypothetical protein